VKVAEEAHRLEVSQFHFELLSDALLRQETQLDEELGDLKRVVHGFKTIFHAMLSIVAAEIRRFAAQLRIDNLPADVQTTTLSPQHSATLVRLASQYRTTKNNDISQPPPLDETLALVGDEMRRQAALLLSTSSASLVCSSGQSFPDEVRELWYPEHPEFIGTLLLLLSLSLLVFRNNDIVCST
jgi:hypothetical protein